MNFNHCLVLPLCEVERQSSLQPDILWGCNISHTFLTQPVQFTIPNTMVMAPAATTPPLARQTSCALVLPAQPLRGGSGQRPGRARGAGGHRQPLPGAQLPPLARTSGAQEQGKERWDPAGRRRKEGAAACGDAAKEQFRTSSNFGKSGHHFEA